MRGDIYLMADGYQGYNKVKEKDYTDPALQGVMYCDKLFAYECSYKEKGAPQADPKTPPQGRETGSGGFVTVGCRNWLLLDTPDGAAANALCLTIVEMAKVYGLNLYEYLKYLLEYHPSKDMSDEELSKLAPWNGTVKEHCKKKAE